jgi:hypothetical protein
MDEQCKWIRRHQVILGDRCMYWDQESHGLNHMVSVLGRLQVNAKKADEEARKAGYPTAE